MIKYVRHITATLIIVVFCLTGDCQMRSAAVSSYQHLNGITIKADMSSPYEHVNKDKVPIQPPSQNLPAATATNDSDDDDHSSPGIWKDFSLIYRIYQQCANENLSVCLKVKLLTGLEKILHSSKTLRIIEGVQFVKSNEKDVDKVEANTDNNRKILSEQDIEATLPRSFDAKEQILNNLIFKKLAGFLRDHTLQVKFPNVRTVDQSWTTNNDIESRGKKKDKKGGGAYIMIPLLLGGTFVPIAYGALAMLAGKALIVSKLALVLASIIGIKKLLSGGEGKEQHEVVVSSSGHSGWGRDMDLAYNGWKAAKESEKVF